MKVYFSQCAITKRSVCHSSFWIGFKVYRQSMIGRRELSLLAAGINSGVLLMTGFLWRHRTKRERENPLSLFHRFIFSFQSIRSLFVLFTLRRYPITVLYIFAKKPFKSWNSLAKYYTISHLVRWWVTKIHSKNISINKNRTRWADKAVHSPFHLSIS